MAVRCKFHMERVWQCLDSGDQIRDFRGMGDEMLKEVGGRRSLEMTTRFLIT